MILSRLLLSLALISILTQSKSAWVGEDFWTTIHYTGEMQAGRSTDDFVHFKISRDDTEESFIGFLIQRDRDGEKQHESFGHVFMRGNRVCGRFLTRHHNDTELVCGAFRVLSRELHNYTSPFYFRSSRVAQPFDSVGYNRIQICRIWVDNNHTVSVFGGVDLSKRTAYGIFSNGSIINIDYSTNPAGYAERIDVLHIERQAMNLVRKKRILRKRVSHSQRKFRTKRKRHHHKRRRSSY